MSKQMIMRVSTNKVGSTCEYELGYTKQEWEEASDNEKSQAMVEIFYNYLDYEVVEED